MLSVVACSICVNSFQSNDAICATTCGHVFHFHCLNKWKNSTLSLRSYECPQCRFFNPETNKLYLTFEQVQDDSKKMAEELLKHCETSILSLQAQCIETKKLIDKFQKIVQTDSSPTQAVTTSETPNPTTSDISKMFISGLPATIRNIQHGKTFVGRMAAEMNIPCNLDEIKNVIILRRYRARHGKSAAIVEFSGNQLKEKFFKNKKKLKNCADMSEISFEEHIPRGTSTLLEQAMLLKNVGYELIYYHNNCVYASWNHRSAPQVISDLNTVHELYDLACCNDYDDDDYDDDDDDDDDVDDEDDDDFYDDGDEYYSDD